MKEIFYFHVNEMSFLSFENPRTTELPRNVSVQLYNVQLSKSALIFPHVFFFLDYEERKGKINNPSAGLGKGDASWRLFFARKVFASKKRHKKL